MGVFWRRWGRFLFSIEKHERVKVLLLSVSFFFIIGAYTLIKELKDSIFVAVVGREYISLAKILSIFFLIPAILVYSKLVDKLRRYQLLSLYCGFYGLFGLIFAVLLTHQTIGIVNTATSPYRLFGWIFYFFIEGYSPFVVSVFWAFSNSINNPESAKQSYGILVASSKFGGMLSAAGAWFLLAMQQNCYITLSHASKHQILLAIASLMLLTVPFIILRLILTVPGQYLHGYEAAYQIEKARHQEEEQGMFSGLKLLIRYPYTMGIFLISFCYEIIQTVLSYQRLGIAQQDGRDLSQISAFLFAIAFFTHLCGFPIALLGTRPLMHKLGERICLLLVPVITFVLFIIFKFSHTKLSFIIFFAVLRAIHYAFDYPLRESLYIPTIKEIKFKSKSWIDSFGSKFAKAVGSLFNGLTIGFTESMFLMAQTGFFSVIIIVWAIIAYCLGKTFEKAIARNEVIGSR